jgi:hypothetical protein
MVTSMSAEWIMSVGGYTYGPYTALQMQTFAAEGRLAPHSLVARAQDGSFGPASQDADLASLFHPAAVSAANQKHEERTRTFGHPESEGFSEPAHFLVLAEMRTGSITALEEEIFALGPAYAVLPQAWVLACDLSIAALRNLLVQKMGRMDTLLIVDATHDKITWSNFGIETETRVRRVWTKQPQESAA